MSKKVAVELKTGERFIGYLVEPNNDAPALLSGLSAGVFLKRKTTISYFANDSIKDIREAKFGERERD